MVSYDRKYVVFGKLVQGDEVLEKVESVGDEEGRPMVTVKIINCGEFKDGNNPVAIFVFWFYFCFILCYCYH